MESDEKRVYQELWKHFKVFAEGVGKNAFLMMKHFVIMSKFFIIGTIQVFLSALSLTAIYCRAGHESYQRKKSDKKSKKEFNLK